MKFVQDVPNGLSLPNQNTILINIIWSFFYKLQKYCNERQLTKNEMKLNNQKQKNHPPSTSTSVFPNTCACVFSQTLAHECFPKHLRNINERTQIGKKQSEKNENERNKVDTK